MIMGIDASVLEVDQSRRWAIRRKVIRAAVAWLAWASIPAATLNGQRVLTASGDYYPTEFLERTWPGHPEWLAMLGEIATGHGLSPHRGWYRKGSGQSRFDWDSVLSRFDTDRDGSISASEFRRPRDFRRLDLNGDGAITAPDWLFDVRLSRSRRNDASFTMSAGVFIAVDRDRNGLVNERELRRFLLDTSGDPLLVKEFEEPGKALLARIDESQATGFDSICLADFQQVFNLSGRRSGNLLSWLGSRANKEVSRENLLKSFLRGELGSWSSGPGLNAKAPDFTLTRVEDQKRITLSKEFAEKPVVLIFGNFTCDHFRMHTGSLESLYQRYRDRVNFLCVYTRESHPLGGWELDSNRNAGIEIRQPEEAQQRIRIAQDCKAHLKISFPIVVDTMNDTVSSLYSGIPIRLYLIDRSGLIAYKGGRGPFHFFPGELEQSVLAFLNDPSTCPPSTHRP
jgi:hypothetical protein